MKDSSTQRAKISQRFFKTAEGEYGEGDTFVGLSMPQCRAVAKEYVSLELSEIEKALRSSIHEIRMVALLIMCNQYSVAEKTKNLGQQDKLFKFYRKNFKTVNNWDLVDVSAPYLAGKYLFSRDRKIIYTWAKSKHLWTRRIAVVSQWWWIRKGDIDDIYRMAPLLLGDKEDLMHKAVGWMLREAGKHDMKKLKSFIAQYYEKMPRTLLRYSIEKFPEKERKKILKGQF